MSKDLRIYLALLTAVVVGWIYLSPSAAARFASAYNLDLLSVIALYLCSHGFRMLRLVLLTLEDRKNALNLITAHALTAFPSSFVPLKLGEALRLASFFRVFDSRQKAIAVWLTERFGDTLVVSMLIFCLYVLGKKVSPSVRDIFTFFLLLNGLGLIGLFTIANVFVYLNRYLVLTSLSPRGLMLLRFSYILRRLEMTIYRSIEGRISSFLLLSVFIWLFEILAITLFMNSLSVGEVEFTELFSFGLLASLPNGNENALGVYQSLALGLLAVFFVFLVFARVHLKV